MQLTSARRVTSLLLVLDFRWFQAGTSSAAAVFCLSAEDHRKIRDSSARKMRVPDYSDELDDVIAAVSICPDCGTSAFAYRSTDAKRDDSDRWDFTCPGCGTDFVISETKLLFRSLPKEWLLSKVYAA